MISLDLLQAAIVTALKADAPLVAMVGDEIRESQWQGTDFTYPGVRVDVYSGAPIGEKCVDTHSVVGFAILCYSENDSSQEADQIAGLVVDALFLSTLTAATFYSGSIRLSGPGVRSARRMIGRTWRSEVEFQTNIYET